MAKKNVAKKSERTEKKLVESAAESAFAPLMELRHRIDDLFDDFTRGWRRPGRGEHLRSLGAFSDFPSLSELGGELADVRFDVSESDDAIEISAELPGMDDKDVELSLANGVLTIKGEKKTESEEKKKNYYSRERRYGSFVRTFRLPESVDDSGIEAGFDKGVLDITLPKKRGAKAKARKIRVSKKEK